MEQDQRGILYPQRLPEFHRLPPPPSLEHAVRWFWIPEWDLPEGAESRQEILPFPACNLVVEPDGITAVGPPTQRSERVLSGRGWAVGALLRPAATPALLAELAAPAGIWPLERTGAASISQLRDAAAPLDAPVLHTAVSAAMSDSEASGEERRARALAACSSWLLERVPVPAPGSDAALANALADLLADPAITRVDQLPPLLHVSSRTLQRLADRCFGLSPHSMIRRRRLQEAAGRLREDPELLLSALASELGYSDHAHFTTDFRALLGVTPSEYRARTR